MWGRVESTTRVCVRGFAQDFLLQSTQAPNEPVVVLVQCREFNCSRRAPGYFTQSVTRLHLPHVIVVKLHEHYAGIVFLTLDTVDVWAVAYSCRQYFPSKTKPWMLPGPRHRGCGLYLLAPLTGNKEGSNDFMVLRGTNTNSVPDQQSLFPDGQHTLAFFTKCMPPVRPLASWMADIKRLLCLCRILGSSCKKHYSPLSVNPVWLWPPTLINLQLGGFWWPWLIVLTNLSLRLGRSSYCKNAIAGSRITVTHLQCIASEMCWLYLSVGYYSLTLWIQTSILSCRAIALDLHKPLIFSLPIGRDMLWQLFSFKSPYSLYWGCKWANIGSRPYWRIQMLLSKSIKTWLT